MERRKFVSYAGLSLLFAISNSGCSIIRAGIGKNNPAETQESRNKYLNKMLSEICVGNKPRLAGSRNYNDAAYTVLRDMKKALPNAKLDKFTLEFWDLKSNPEFIIGEQKIEAYPSIGSMGTPSGGLTGFVIENNDKNVQYAVVNSAKEKIAEIVIWQSGAISRSCGPFGRKPKCLPLFIIGGKDEPLLKKAIAENIPVKANYQVDFIPDAPTCNVVGTLPGESKEEIIFMAHLDTVAISSGANDNTASMILVLLLAHAFSGMRPKKTLTFLVTAGEETGSYGSKHYFEQRKKDGTFDHIKCSFNFDSVTWGPELMIHTTDDEIREQFIKIAEPIKIPGSLKPVNEKGDGIDNSPLRGSYVTCVYVGSEGSDAIKFWHRPDDMPENVNLEYVEYSFRVFSEYMKQYLL